jgi:hypothetical protein
VSGVEENRPRKLDAKAALLALRALDLRYTPDLSVVDGAWCADCPICRARGALRIRELRERDDDHRDPLVSVGCTRRCAEPNEIAVLLSTDVNVLEARAEAARWRMRYRWALDSWRRTLTADVSDDASALRAAA